MLIEPEGSMIPIYRQCDLLDLARSSYYYCSCKDDSYNVMLTNLIDEQYTKTPFYGVPKMTAWLRRQGHQINPKRIRRLIRLMGIEAIYPKKRLSKSRKEHMKYPYLLRGLIIDHPNQVWCADITYIRMLHGFVYLVAIMDWFSRYVLSWKLSTTLEKPPSAQRHYRKPSNIHPPRYLTLIKEFSLRVRNLQTFFTVTESKSAWTVMAGPMTTSL